MSESGFVKLTYNEYVHVLTPTYLLEERNFYALKSAESSDLTDTGLNSGYAKLIDVLEDLQIFLSLQKGYYRYR